MQEMRDHAKKELNDWYKNYDDQLAKNIKTNKYVEYFENITSHRETSRENIKIWDWPINAYKKFILMLYDCF